jgi:YVTN family beta-propeller protein
VPLTTSDRIEPDRHRTVQIASTPDGSAAFVASEDDDTVSRIDTSTNTSTTTIDVGDRPIAVAVTPDGGFVYVTNALEPSVSVIEVASDMVIETITVAASPIDLAIMPAPVP